jgi:pyridoxamine 5'-phosphate oxidase-like protein
MPLRPAPEQITDADGNRGRLLVELDRAEALALLASVPMGRVVFTMGALPAIRPVNHILDEDTIIIRTRLTAKLTTAVAVADDTVVAYEADELDPLARLGWSVVVTGIARPVTEPGRVARYEDLLSPWVDKSMDVVIGIRAEIVTGFRLLETG